MSKVSRSFLLIIPVLALTFAFLPTAPAHATFSTTCALTANGLPTIRMQGDSDGGVTFYVDTPDGAGRFMQIRPAGGHWEIHSMHDLPAGTALQLDDNGFPIVIQD
ncbi:MAG TPA: hypothetical protein VGG20_01265 [Thermoanaerobaculia bacterium]|jgi:hypothetical protein